MSILVRISQETPGVKLEHLEVHGDRQPEPWEEVGRKILPVERWMRIVWTDFQNAPPEAKHVIAGRHYKWYRDEWGRAIILANHQGEFVPMFEEVWAGDPLS